MTFLGYAVRIALFGPSPSFTLEELDWSLSVRSQLNRIVVTQLFESKFAASCDLIGAFNGRWFGGVTIAESFLVTANDAVSC